MQFFTTSKLSENIQETPEGYLVCLGVAIARIGEMVYGDGEVPLEVGDDGKIIVGREEDDLFRPETVKSFEGKPLTILHPEDFVNPDNWASLTKGVVQNVRRGEGDLKTDLLADILVTDNFAINLVKNGLREVSCGYLADYIQTKKGRGIQKNIVGNHLALVEQGRAGAAYAINDHKGKGSTMSVKDKIAKIFQKAQDEALAVATSDEAAPKEKEKEKTSGYSMDEVMGAVQKLGEKVDGFVANQKAKDATTPPTENQPAKVVAKDADATVQGEPSLSDRLSKLEAAVAKIVEKLAATGDDDGDVDGDDGDDTFDEKSCDDDMSGEDLEESAMTGDGAGNEDDIAARVEILAPGMKASGQNLKARALKVAYVTKDGKSVIDTFTGGKAPDLKNEKLVDAIFVGASELLKSKRGEEFAKTKTHDAKSFSTSGNSKYPSPEEVNKKNAEHYAKLSQTQH